MKRLPPIPIPVAQRWREIKIKLIPFLAFVAAAMALAFLWQQHVSAPTLIGQVEATHADVVSPDAGILTNLWVTRFQPVKAGDVIATVNPVEPRAALALNDNLRSRTALAQLELNASLDRERNAFDFQRLRLDTLRQRVDLATDKAKLQQAENELKRQKELFHDKLISPSQFDLAVRAKDSMDAQVTEKLKLLADMEKTLDQLKALAAVTTNNVFSRELLLAVRKEKDSIPTIPFEPVILRAPIDGTVSVIYRRAGENIIAGEPIVTISATEGERIITYVRQPIFVDPKIGAPVQIRRRTAQREQLQARILSIGRQFEVIAPALQRPGVPNELGLPIAVSLPSGAKLTPSELVEISFRPE